MRQNKFAASEDCKNKREIILGCVFWENRFFDYFVQFCLPSLLAVGNLSALSIFEQKRFLIVTRDIDFARLKKTSVYKKACKYIEFEHIKLAADSGGMDKMARMSTGHLEIASRMASAKAYGIFVYPDTVFSRGTLKCLMQKVRENEVAVLALCPRLANEGFLRSLLQSNREDRDVFDLNSRDMLHCACENMHSETMLYNWSAPYFSRRPVMIFEKVEDGSGFIFHSTNWAPILLDYNALPNHDDSTLREWTIDGDYIWRNWGKGEKVSLIIDSDELSLGSFTDESDLTYLPLKKERIFFSTILGQIYRCLTLRAFLFSDEIDPLKRSQFSQPIEVRIGKRSSSAWKRAHVKLKTARKAAEKGPLSNAEKILLTILVSINEGVWMHLRFWFNNYKNKHQLN